MAESMTGLKILADFAPLAGVPEPEFLKRVPYPVMVVGAPQSTIPPMPNREEPTGTRKSGSSLAMAVVEQLVIPLEAKGRQPDGAIVVGRGTAADVLLPFEAISRTHARVSRDKGGRLFITDLGSKNGTFLNGERLKPNQTYALKDGDRVKLGELEGTLLMPESFHRALKTQGRRL